MPTQVRKKKAKTAAQKPRAAKQMRVVELIVAGLMKKGVARCAQANSRCSNASNCWPNTSGASTCGPASDSNQCDPCKESVEASLKALVSVLATKV